VPLPSMRALVSRARLTWSLGLLLSFVAASEDFAAAHQSEGPGRACPSGALCAYWDSHENGDQYQFFGDNGSWHSWAIADDDSSSWNRGTTGLRVEIRANTNHGGARIVCLLRGAWQSHHVPNDAGSSNRWLSSC
jgi:hypothetical protein